MFQFDTATLESELTPFIESIFHYSDFVPEHSVERVVPTGHVFLLFELDGFERHTFDDDLRVLQRFNKAWVSGLQRSPIAISSHEHSQMLVVQFKAHGAAPFLRESMSRFADSVICGEKVSGAGLHALRDELWSLSRAELRFEHLQRWLMRRMDQHYAPPPELLEVISRLQATPADKFAQAVEHYPHSQKHLIDQFQKFLGVTPKIYQRILRFNEVFEYLQRNQEVGWAAVAQHCGYADQSHFIREFRHFTGFNPAQFLREGYDVDEPNFFPIG